MRSFPRPMLPSLLPEKGKYKIHGGVEMKGTVQRDFKVLTEKISPENIAVMAELIAMRETKTLIGFMGYHAEKAHKKLCKDIFCKDKPGIHVIGQLRSRSECGTVLMRSLRKVSGRLPVHIRERETQDDKI